MEDTVEVVVLDPHEAHGSVGQDGRQVALLLLVHQDGHEVLDLRHVDVAPVVTADQHLKHTRGEGWEGVSIRFSFLLLLGRSKKFSPRL